MAPASPGSEAARAWALTALLRAVWRVIGPAVAARYPRAQHAVEALAALSPDLVRFAAQVLKALTGVSLVQTADAAELARARDTIARQAAQLHLAQRAIDVARNLPAQPAAPAAEVL